MCSYFNLCVTDFEFTYTGDYVYLYIYTYIERPLVGKFIESTPHHYISRFQVYQYWHDRHALQFGLLCAVKYIGCKMSNVTSVQQFSM